MTPTPLQILKQYWGYNAFRNNQEAVITHLSAQKNALLLMQTGGGKSLCFQVPAMCNSGICIVISPLISLIKDQIQHLQQKGIKAIGLTGKYSQNELSRLLDNAHYGHYKFLYLSPERLLNDIVIERIKSMPVNLIAIDEAHCISQWGHDFRPAYRQLYQLKQWHPDAPLIALTATATPKVTDDIVDLLQVEDIQVFKHSFERKNIAYQVFETEDKIKLLQRIARASTQSMIVYVATRRQVKDIYMILSNMGLSVSCFHGGLDDEQKTKNLNQWIDDQTPIMVATNAFGMGIDKPNVRTIVHLHIPQSIENYYQETGRAGRDGSSSQAYLLFSKSDELQAQNLYINQYPDIEDLRKVYQSLNTYFLIAYGGGVDDGGSLDLSSFAKTYGLDVITLHHSLKALANNEIISYSSNHNKQFVIQFLVDGESLRQHIQRNKKAAPMVNAILRSYVNSYQDKIAIDIYKLSHKIECSFAIFLEQLQILDQQQILTLKVTDTSEQIRFLVSREDQYTMNSIRKNHLQNRQIRIDQFEKMLVYAKDTSRCKNSVLMDYFGESTTEDCGQCSVCKRKKNTKEPDIKKEILSLLVDLPKTMDELFLLFEISQRDEVIAIISKLLLEEIIALNPQNRLYII